MTIQKELLQLLDVLNFAAEKHRNQFRKDGFTPYINHPIQVANLLVQNGEDDVALLSAALLHDTIEDTETSEEEIRNHFGDEVLSLVLEVTDNKNLPSDMRKQQQIKCAPHASRRAKALKLADKICNVRDIAICPPANWSLDRRHQYLNWSEKVVAGLRGTNTALELLFDHYLSHGRDLLDEERIINSQ